MDQELNKCAFCGLSKPVLRKYLNAKNPPETGNGFAFICYCEECGLDEIKYNTRSGSLN